MSNDAGDTSSRLSDALSEIFDGAARQADESNGNGDRNRGADGGEPTQPVAAIDDEPYELPPIIPATREATPVELPRLPDPTTGGSRPSASTQQPAPTTVRSVPSVPAAAPAAPAPGTSGATTPNPTPAAPATGWADHVGTPGVSSTGQLRAPGRRPRVRRVTRVLRHIDPWSTFKVALLFSVVAYVVALTSGVLLWRVADSTGTLANVERWFTQFGWETFELKGGDIFQNAWIIGLFCVVAATGGAVLLVTLFNLVSDIVGGIRMTVLEEEVVERTISSTRRYVVRRPPGDVARAGATAVADWSVDGDDEPDADEPVTESPAPDRSPPPTTDWSVDDD